MIGRKNWEIEIQVARIIGESKASTSLGRENKDLREWGKIVQQNEPT